jgi:hypothetical protein
MKFVNYQNLKPEIGSNLSCDIYVKASEQKVVLMFKAGSEFSLDDLTRFNKYHDSNVLFIREEDYLLMFAKESKDIKASFEANGEVDTKAGFAISKSFFNSEQILKGDNKLDSMVKMANQFVVDLLNSSKDQRTQALVEILKGLNTSDNVFVNHSNQVAAVSTMIALMVENVSIENIVEINLVAILHGIGLMHMSSQQSEFFETYADISNFKESVGKTDVAVVNKVVAKHFDGHNKLTTADNIIFYQHLTLIEANIDKIKIKNIKSQNIIKTIADFKKILGTTEETKQISNPYISAKILAVGDRLVSLMTFYEKNPAFFENSVKEIKRINEGEKPIFDTKIIEKVSMMV